MAGFLAHRSSGIWQHVHPPSGPAHEEGSGSTMSAWLRRPRTAAQILNLYVWLIMSLLLIQGIGSLILRLNPQVAAVTPEPFATIMNGNTPHAILHITWGIFG